MMQTIANIAQIVGLFKSLSGTDANQKFVAAMEHVLSNKIKVNKPQAEKMAKEFGITDLNLVKNLIELAIVHQGRKLAHAPGSIKQRFDSIVELYKTQTNLSLRTSTSMMFQQYSTPAPIGYLMGIFCGINKPNITVFEPSAGNGLLTIAAHNINQVTVNEYEQVRYENLLTQDFNQVTFGDATQKLVPNKSFDAVITNPPFGPHKETVDFSGFKISTLDHVMAIRALQAMKDEGKAAIIIGGHTNYDKQGRIEGVKSKDRLLLSYLYKYYHVADIIPIYGANLYSRQGTSFDTRLILINGRKQQAGGMPPLNPDGDTKVKDFDTLFERVMQFVENKPAKPTKTDTYFTQAIERFTQAKNNLALGLLRHVINGTVITNNLNLLGKELLALPAKASGDDIGPILAKYVDGRFTDDTKAKNQSKRNADFEQRAYQGTPQEIMEAIIEDKQAYQNELTNEELEFVNQNYFIPTGYIYNKNWELVPTNNDMAKKIALAKAKIAIAKALKAKTSTQLGAKQKDPRNLSLKQQSKISYDKLVKLFGATDIERYIGTAKQYFDAGSPYNEVYEYFSEEMPHNLGGIDGLGMVYTPVSTNPFSLKVETPDSMGYEIHKALDTLKRNIGSIDNYVMLKLKYKNLAELYNGLASEQIDAVALAIYNIEQKGQSIIIADQTGIGKGRQAAALIRYGIMQGKKPIFFTQDPALFSSMYQDLLDIGSANYVPYIVNADEPKTRVRDKDENVIYKPLKAADQKKIVESQELPYGYDYVMVTYSQIQTGNDFDDVKKIVKRKSAKNWFINNISKNNILVMDEAHEASGDSVTGALMMDNLEVAAGALFLSATYAKTPFNLPIYAAKTAINEASLDRAGLVEAITAGGVALQEVVSSQLVESGQLIRRERPLPDNLVIYTTLDAKKAEHMAVYDNLTKIIRDIIYFQQTYIDPHIAAIDKIMAAQNKNVDNRKGSKNVGVNNAPAFSKAFNLVNQMLLCLKADDVANKTIEYLKKGYAPVIALANTMGSFLNSMQEENGSPVKQGSVINADFSNVLMAALNGSLRYTISGDDDTDEKEAFEEDSIEDTLTESVTTEVERKGKAKKKGPKYMFVDITELDQEAQESYNKISEAIRSVSSGLVISPIDLIKQKIEKAGYIVAELTGRKLAVEIQETTTQVAMVNPANIFGGNIPDAAKKLIPPFQLKALKEFMKGEEGEFFIQQINEIGKIGEALKKRSLEKENTEWQKVNTLGNRSYYKDIALPSLRYFSNSHEIYVYEWIEKDNLLFTYTILNGDTQNAEFGYQSLDEMFANYGFGKNIEMDLHFTPKPLRQLLKDDNFSVEGLGSLKTMNERTMPDIIPAKTQTQTKTYFTGTVYNRKTEVKKTAFNRFNNNEIDVLIINESAATGQNAHAVVTDSVPLEQVRRRVYIGAQAELDVNIEVQKLGRINRTGQVLAPFYDYLVSVIPAEQRLKMMLQKKIKSLSANTTSNQKSADSLVKSNDFLNKYGDKLIFEYMAENPDMNLLINDPLELGSSDADSGKKVIKEPMNKVAGRIAILPSEMQTKFYTEMQQMYNDYVDELVQSGEYDLEVEYMDLQAELIGEPQVAKGGKGGDSPFGDNTYLEKHEVNILRKPYTVTELENLVNNKLQGKTPTEYMNEIKTNFVSFVTEKHNIDLQKIATEYAQLTVEVELGNDKKFNKSIAGITDQNVIKELKAQRIQELDEARENAIALSKKSFENKKKYLMDIFEDFYPGKNLRYVSQGSLGVDNENPPFCVFIGYSFNKTAANPYAPSAIKLHFAIASGRKASTIAASKVSDIAAIKGASTREYAMTFEEVKENWFDVINMDAKDRGIRYIATGNLLQAYSVEEFRTGKLVQFTTKDGRMRKGLYLEYYNPDGNGSNKEKFVPVMPIYKARKAISSLSNNAAVLNFDGFNGHIQRAYNSDNFEIVLKMDKTFKSINANIYLDQTLLPFIVDRNFRQVSATMRGSFTPENLDNVCEILQNKHNINVRLQPWQMELIKDEIQGNKFTDEVIEPAPMQEVTIEVPITANVEDLKDTITEKFGDNPNIVVTSLPKYDWEQIAADKAKTKAKALAKAKIAIARAKMLMSKN